MTTIQKIHKEYDPDIAKQFLLSMIMRHGDNPVSYEHLKIIRNEMNITDEQFWISENTPYLDMVARGYVLSDKGKVLLGGKDD